MNISDLSNENFYIEHINDSENTLKLISEFSVSENGALGLEKYLKLAALYDEEDMMSRTYLVKDSVTNELVGYFSLRTGLITVQISADKLEFDSIPAIELSNFAINSNYKQKHPEVKKSGAFILKNFILPIVHDISLSVGVKALYIYALPNEKLIEHYKSMGFMRLPENQEKFVQTHVKPKYDAGCIFMFQSLT